LRSAPLHAAARVRRLPRREGAAAGPRVEPRRGRPVPRRQRSARIAVLAMSEDPTFFVSSLRELLNAEPFAALAPKPELTMFGRTYASGFEADLDEWLLRRPRRTALNPAWPWAIWYPLRRTGGFSRLTPQEQG